MSSENAAQEIRELLKNGLRCDLHAIIDTYSVNDPEEIAFLIDVDARSRLDLGQTVTLNQYDQSLRAFMQHSVVLDAAIDMALKSFIRSGVSIDEAAESLAQRHPEYLQSITNAVSLTKALWNTSDIAAAPAWVPPRLPAPFGPVTGKGNQRYRLEEQIASGSSGGRLPRVRQRSIRSGCPGYCRDQGIPRTESRQAVGRVVRR